MSQEDRKPPLAPETLTPLFDFASKLTGLQYLVASVEGLPIVYTGVTREIAEAVAALGIDVIESSYKAVREIADREPKTVYIDTGEGRALSLSKARELILAAYGRYPMVREMLRSAALYLNGERVKCRACGGDLTLATSECPHCGAVIPFISEKCPVCGEPLGAKRCPHCGSLITPRGEPVEAAEAEQKSTPDKVEEAAKEYGAPGTPYSSRSSHGILALAGLGSALVGVMSGYGASLAWGVDVGLLVGSVTGGILGLGAEVLLLRSLKSGQGSPDKRNDAESR